MIWFISSQNFVGSSFPRSLRVVVVVVLVAMLFSVDKLHKNRKKNNKKTQVVKGHLLMMKIVATAFIPEQN